MNGNYRHSTTFLGVVMKKILLILGLYLSFTTAAFAELTTFTTIEQAEKRCPSIKTLKFAPNSPSITNLLGTVTGKKGIEFESFPPRNAPRPMNMNSTNIIQDANFNNVKGSYGFVANKVISCFYSYKASNGKFGLVMRNK